MILVARCTEGAGCLYASYAILAALVVLVVWAVWYAGKPR